jgi:hypothetical protein
MQRATTLRAVAGTLAITLATGTSFAQEVRHVTAVRAELEAAGTDQRVGVELQNGSRLFGAVGTLKKDRFDLNDRPGHSFKVHYDEVLAFLDPNTGSVTGIVVKAEPHKDNGMRLRTKVIIVVWLSLGFLAWLENPY